MDVSQPIERPSFDALPLNEDDPPYSAWGLYGPQDQLGTLNLLSPATTLQAAQQEIRTGVPIPLNLPLHIPLAPMNPARRPLQHTLIEKGHANDDELALDTQSSSQWDGLRHYPYAPAALPNPRRGAFYNGTHQHDLLDPTTGAPTPVLGIQHMARRGGIQGRGILLDWARWAQTQNKPFEPFTAHAVPLSDLLAIAAAQDTPPFREGDILLIRTGWTAAYRALSTPEQQRALAARPERAFVGVEASEAMLRWHWENGFAAVASDTNAYEVQPFARGANARGVSCHEVFLSGWGMPIGELWDLEALAAECARRGRWTFFLSSCPLDVVGGVGSPANAVAIL